MFTANEYKDICDRIAANTATEEDITRIIQAIIYIGFGEITRMLMHFITAIRTLAGKVWRLADAVYFQPSNISSRIARLYAAHNEEDLFPSYFCLVNDNENVSQYLETIMIEATRGKTVNDIQTGISILNKLNDFSKRLLVNHCFAKLIKDFDKIIQVPKSFLDSHIYAIESEEVPCFHKYTTLSINNTCEKRMFISLVPKEASEDIHVKQKTGLSDIFKQIQVNTPLLYMFF